MAGSVADRLNHLFAAVYPAGRGPYTNAEVAAATGLAPSYITYLRNGKRANPTIQTIDALASFFGVKPAYFHDDEIANRVDQQLDQLRSMAALHQALQREGVQQLATRMGDLSDGGIAAIAQLVDLLLAREQRKDKFAGENVDGGT